MSSAAAEVAARTAVASQAPGAIAHEVVWGPVSKEEADACRALAPCSAVLLSPLRTAAYAAVEEAVRGVIPQEILPRDSDTADSPSRPRLQYARWLAICDQVAAFVSGICSAMLVLLARIMGACWRSQRRLGV